MYKQTKNTHSLLVHGRRISRMCNHDDRNNRKCRRNIDVIIIGFITFVFSGCSVVAMSTNFGRSTNSQGLNRFGLRPPNSIPKRPFVQLDGPRRNRQSKSTSNIERKYTETLTPYEQQLQQFLMLSADTKRIITSSCECGAFQIQFPAPPKIDDETTTTSLSDTNVDNNIDVMSKRTTAVDCHCASCRKYHVAAFSSYLQVPKNDITFVGNRPKDDVIASYNDYCSGGLGIPGSIHHRTPVKRIYCKYCSSKMYTEPVLSNSESPMVLINMGSIDDETIPYDLENAWKKQEAHVHHLQASTKSMEQRHFDSQYGRTQWKVSETAPWTWSIPKLKNRMYDIDNDDDDWNEPNYNNPQQGYDYGQLSKSNFQRNDYSQQQQQQQGYYATDVMDEIENDYYNSTWAYTGNTIFGEGQVITINGGCTCGTCTYTIQFQSPSELQHCYCTLCRRLSGGAFMTWIPIPLQDFEWTNLPQPAHNNPTMYNPNYITVDNGDTILRRYTDHGQRHVCPTCQSVMTISYDIDGDEVIWIAAATMDNINLPAIHQALGYYYLDRVVHICCSSLQAWYQLPDDGMTRLDGAS